MLRAEKYSPRDSASFALEESQLPRGLTDEHLKPGSLLATHKDESSKVAGILMLPSGPVLIDSRPVVTSNSEGPGRRGR